MRSVRTELTMSGACEATVLLEEGDRVRAAAARLELLRERWILTGLEMA
ncbi:Rv3235 family protein [Actinomyces oris]|nr:Rv3235 family protein [Actinomyces oris]